ncbi:acyl-CoA/acyl-ACP dehydrogenase [Rhodococcus sp. D2-41]|uniref:Acyl-CoA/acyl-ACP dehydrogenase n=1 Tax=Speluncibacter jeojiensis TaxID=2710754 RepID=A0A9X4RFK8_9ACTN|nr:acyl-CoA dehydrogenase family protein [Rhodococcus sp. D2-41]MDG3009915.1 acyl-CoA/acyl-ACP dehydrogenase [Rhodococcus sp. D2-41]MDG3017150.1 acyl-CoA/acyl-ACP dehydrogenase [Corynebacteriales bacterium D3-21]
MDFTFGSEQQAVAEVAATVLQTAASAEALAAMDRKAPVWDATLWKRLADEGVLSLPLPESLGGDDLGIGEIGVLLGQVGRHAAQVPVLETLGFGVLPLLALGGDAKRFLAGVPGGAILTAALSEPGAPLPATPATTATADGDGYVVSGRKVGVRYAEQAAFVLVPTSAGVAVVAPDADGVTLTRTFTASLAPEYTMVLENVRVDAGALLTAVPVAQVYRIALAAVAAQAAGLGTGMTDLTAKYVSGREQFGKPIAVFQAVSQQLADSYVTARTLELAARSACWRLSEGLDAAEDTSVAAYWMAERLPVSMQQCSHMHGGMGADVTYPAHLYYEQTKDLVRLVGGPSSRLSILGALSARDLGVEAACSSI